MHYIRSRPTGIAILFSDVLSKRKNVVVNNDILKVLKLFLTILSHNFISQDFFKIYYCFTMFKKVELPRIDSTGVSKSYLIFDYFSPQEPHLNNLIAILTRPQEQFNIYFYKRQYFYGPPNWWSSFHLYSRPLNIFHVSYYDCCNLRAKLV